MDKDKLSLSPSDNTPTENELQRKYGTNWTEKNFQTILNWTFIAAFHIQSLEYAIDHYKKIIRNNIVLGLVLSTASGTISSTRLGMNDNSPLNFSLNILFTAMSFTIAIFTGTIKIYQIQERLENFIKLKQDWIVFSTTLASELQLPVNLRHDAYYIIIKNKSKYLDLLKIDNDIPNFIKEKVRNKLINKNKNGPLKNHIDSLNITNLSDIIIQISSNENERFDIENNINSYYKELKTNFKILISKELEDNFKKITHNEIDNINDNEIDNINNINNIDNINNINNNEIDNINNNEIDNISDKLSNNILENILKNDKLKNIIENGLISNIENSGNITNAFNEILNNNLENIIKNKNINEENLKNISQQIMKKKEFDKPKILNMNNIPNDNDNKLDESISPV